MSYKVGDTATFTLNANPADAVLTNIKWYYGRILQQNQTAKTFARALRNLGSNVIYAKATWNNQTITTDPLIVSVTELSSSLGRAPDAFTNLNTNQKYRIIDPVNFEYVRGKKVQVTRYWSVRYLSPSNVASLIARGFEVQAVNQDTPLSPRIVYAPSVVARSKELAPSVRTTSSTEPYSREIPEPFSPNMSSIRRRSHSSFKDFAPPFIPTQSLNRNRTRRRSIS